MIVAFVALFCQPLLKAQSYWGDANLNTINSGSSVIFNNGGNFGGWSTPSITNISSSVLTNDHFVENVRQAIPVRFEADWYIQEMTWGTRPDYVFRNLTPTGEFQYLGTYSDGTPAQFQVWTYDIYGNYGNPTYTTNFSTNITPPVFTAYNSATVNGTLTFNYTRTGWNGHQIDASGSPIVVNVALNGSGDITAIP
jgi:hypothetical protein